MNLVPLILSFQGPTFFFPQLLTEQKTLITISIQLIWFRLISIKMNLKPRAEILIHRNLIWIIQIRKRQESQFWECGKRYLICPIRICRKRLMVCSQANLTTKILYRLGTVENCVPEKNSSLLSKKKKKKYATSNWSMETYIHVSKIEWFDWNIVCMLRFLPVMWKQLFLC